MKKFLALLLAAMMLLGMTSAFAEATDTITVMVPPVTGTYLDDIDTWANDFMAEHPEIKVEVIKTSWDDHNSKLNTMANAGEAPDIAEVSYSAIGTYVELGLGVEIDQYMDAERLADYDQNALDYMSLDGHVYGLPLYITIQALGANKDMLEAAAVDQTLLLDPVCKSGREAYVSPEGLDEGNVKSAARAIGLVVAPPAGITSEQSANAKILMDEVIIPKFQALLAGETTAQEMFDTIVKEAQNVFGAENCVSGQL